MKVVIVGGGVVGLATAYQLRKSGHAVTVVDSSAYGQGPSHGNAALVTNILSFPVPAPGSVGLVIRSILGGGGAIQLRPRIELGYIEFLLRMALATRRSKFAAGTAAQEILSRDTFDAFDEFVADGLEFERHELGSLHVFESVGEFDAAMREFEPYPEVLSRIQPLVSTEQIQTIDPGIAPRFQYGYYAAGDRQVEPDSFMTALVGAIRAGGGELIEHCAVTGFVRTSSGAVQAVITSAGSIDADAVIVAAGVGSRAVLKMLGWSLPNYSGGGYSLDIPVPEEIKPRTSVMTSRTHIAVTPLDRGLRVSSGMIVGQGQPPTVSRATAIELVGDLHQLYPATAQVPADVDERWAGLRPMSADGVPVIGPVPSAPGAYVATGHTMLGLTYAPATARMLAHMVSGEPTPREWESLSPARFTGPIWK